MNRSERIPTLHELRLAGRVERARALFGPGGYLDLCVSEKTKPPERGHGGPAATAPAKHPGVAVEVEEGEDNKARNISSTAVEGSRRGNGGGGAAREGKRPEEGHKDHSSPSPPPPSSSSLAEHGRVPTKTNVGPPRPALEKTRLDGVGEGSGRAGRTGATRGAVTIVTLTIVGGRAGGRGFTNLEQSGKVPFIQSEPTAPACAHRMHKNETSGLGRGTLGRGWFFVSSQ